MRENSYTVWWSQYRRIERIVPNSTAMANNLKNSGPLFFKFVGFQCACASHDLANPCTLHSRSQSPRFFWSRGQRNEGLWQPQPDVVKFRTSGNTCAVVNIVSAHAQIRILREGRDILGFVIT